MSDRYFYSCTRCKASRTDWGVVREKILTDSSEVDVLLMKYECGTEMRALRDKSGRVTNVIWNFCKHEIVSGHGESFEVLKGRWG